MRSAVPAPTALALAALLLTGCGGGRDPVAGPSPAPSRPPSPSRAAVSPSAAPTPAAAARTPEALAALVQFTAPTGLSPVQEQVVADYEAYIRAFVVAQGQPSATYAPLLERLGPAARKGVVGQLQLSVDAEEYVLGPYVETVLQVGRGPQTVPLLVCTNGDGRVSYDLATGARKPDRGIITRTKIAITMVVSPTGYVVDALALPEDSSC